MPSYEPLVGLSTDLASQNPVLLAGQIGIESDTGREKIGNGDNWNDIPYTSDSGWTSPTLLNSWANVGSGNHPLQYRKGLNGLVTIEGAVSGGTNNPIMSLPTAYRPTSNVITAILVVTGGGNAAGYISIGSNGDVIVRNLADGAPSSAFFSVSYYAGS